MFLPRPLVVRLHRAFKRFKRAASIELKESWRVLPISELAGGCRHLHAS
jgi:hypothetical protein